MKYKLFTPLFLSLSIVTFSISTAIAEDDKPEMKPDEIGMHQGKGMHHGKGHGMFNHDMNTAPTAEVELSDAAKAGKLLFITCDSCHNEARDPAMAPPMFAVQNYYKNAYPDKDEFVERIVDFVTAPTIEQAMLKRPVEMLGLMPAIPLAKEELSNIASYIYEEQFGKPCEHWRIVIETAEKAGKVDAHIEDEKRKYQRFCSK